MTTTNFNKALAATTAVVAATSGHKVRLLGCTLVADGNVDVTIVDSDSTALYGPAGLIAGTPWTLPVSAGSEKPGSACWAVTGSGKGLSVTLGGAVQVTGGFVTELQADE